MIYRNPAILRFAQSQSCQCCGTADGTVVAAHSNQLRHGKAKSQKAHDCFVAYMCHKCHHEIDQGTLLTKGERIAMWQLAHEKSVQLFKHLLDDQGIATLENDGMGWESLLS